MINGAEKNPRRLNLLQKFMNLVPVMKTEKIARENAHILLPSLAGTSGKSPSKGMIKRKITKIMVIYKGGGYSLSNIPNRPISGF